MAKPTLARRISEFIGVALFALALIWLIALVTYDPSDPAWFFTTDEGQAPAKPWLTVVLDDYSRAVAGYFLTFDAPSALNTSLALRQAIWRKDDPHWHVCGIPQTLYRVHYVILIEGCPDVAEEPSFCRSQRS